MEHCLTRIEKVDTGLTSWFRFPPEFVGFEGHFPTKKILPGACQIQCIVSTIEKGLAKTVFLKEVILAKYLTPVFPDEEILCTIQGVSNDMSDDRICKGVITKNSVKVAELKLSISLKDGKRK